MRSLMVSLRDLYCGTSKKLSVSHNVICSNCACSGCKASGMKLVKLYYYGLVQQPCNDCGGRAVVETTISCPGCNDDKVVQEKKIIEVHDEGMPVHKKPDMKGNLHIHFIVEYPDSLTMEQHKALEGLRKEEIKIKQAEAPDEDDDMHERAQIHWVLTFLQRNILCRHEYTILF